MNRTDIKRQTTGTCLFNRKDLLKVKRQTSIVTESKTCPVKQASFTWRYRLHNQIHKATFNIRTFKCNVKYKLRNTEGQMYSTVFIFTLSMSFQVICVLVWHKNLLPTVWMLAKYWRSNVLNCFRFYFLHEILLHICLVLKFVTHCLNFICIFSGFNWFFTHYFWNYLHKWHLRIAY